MHNRMLRKYSVCGLSSRVAPVAYLLLCYVFHGIWYALRDCEQHEKSRAEKFGLPLISTKRLVWFHNGCVLEMRARPYRRVCVYIIVNQITLQHGMMANSLRMKHCANERRGNEPFKLPISISIYIALRVMDEATTELNNKVMPSFHAPRVQWIPLRGGGRANGTMELMRRPGGINRLRRCSVLFFFFFLSC